MRRAILLLILALPAAGTLAACAGTRAGPAKASVDAVVLDEAQRQKAAAAAEATASSSDAMAKVADGPKAEKPVP